MGLLIVFSPLKLKTYLKIRNKMKFFALAALGALSLIATAEALPWNYVYAQQQAPGYFHASGLFATDPLFYNTYNEVPYQYNLLTPYYYTDFYAPYQHNFLNHGITFAHQSRPFNQAVFEIKGKESKTPIVNVDPINEGYDDKYDNQTDHNELIEEILDDDYEEYKSDQDNASLDDDYEEYEYDVAKIGGRNDSPSRN